MRGAGFTFAVPSGWTVTRTDDSVVAKHGGALVSVTRFPLLKAYDPGDFRAVAKELDGVAKRLDAHAKGETIQVAGRKVRAYSYGAKRIAFVLEAKREYQLFCTRDDAACDLLFRSFALSGPTAR